MMLTDTCIYTIKHSRDLRAALAKGSRDTYTERKKWARAKQLLDSARRSSHRLPIVFAPAEETLRLFGWALLDDVVVADDVTTYSFSRLTLFAAGPLKTALRKVRDGKPLAKGFIRPYAICRTPPWLVEQISATGL